MSTTRAGGAGRWRGRAARAWQASARRVSCLDPKRALLRGEFDRLERLEALDLARVRAPAAAARLDALAALKERSLVERDAPPLLQPGTYLEPFALRALGAVREDDLLIEQAVDRFAAMGLEWHAEQSRRLLAPT
jgi:hypothetical protein